jgi:hypothetical protein
MHNIRRTAVYAIRPYGGVGGGSCKASPYPDRTASMQHLVAAFCATGGHITTGNPGRRDPGLIEPFVFRA